MYVRLDMLKEKYSRSSVGFSLFVESRSKHHSIHLQKKAAHVISGDI